ncbi:hypothetical protein F3F96_01415 [Mariprofundus sp. NF]|uniref:hypothetical protein n=1 Tax=Mariprofundus sp. NF TaxID=2608716 RepID=UPI0015A377DC|nr:hypothetical protein [Mariprofundus sp. NF]NWF37801.1 hypothetical protein [Mariprofundus sp. NF]
MKYLRLFVLILISAVLAGCASNRPNLLPVDSPPKIIVQNGFSFMPLNESEWYIIERQPYEVSLAKRGAATDETFAIQGKVFQFPTFASNESFMQAVKQGQANDTDPANPGRYVTLTHDIELYEHRGETCAYSHIVTEDHAARKRTSTPGFMILDVYALICRHPQNQNAAISFNYSQRNYAQNLDKTLESKARRLIESLEFTALQ